MPAYSLPLTHENNAQSAHVNTNPEAYRATQSVIVQELKQALTLHKGVLLPASPHIRAGSGEDALVYTENAQLYMSTLFIT